MNHLLRVGAAALICFSSAPVRAEQLLFGSGNALYTYDTGTDQLGPALTVTGLEFLRSIDFHADGRLYALDAATQPQLYTINLASGAATPVGSPLAALSGVNTLDLDFDGSGLLRIVAPGGPHLLINPDTGAVLDSGPALPVLGIGHVGSAAYGIGGELDNSLVTVNLATAAVTPIGNIVGFPVPVFGFGFDVVPGTGKAYGYYDTAFGSPDGELYEIDLATGQATFLRRSGLFVPTLTVVPVPEPGAITLTLCAAAAALALRRRKA